MSRDSTDFTQILVQQGILSPAQAEDAKQITLSSLPETLQRLGYASGEQVLRAVAQARALDYVDLSQLDIPTSVIEQIPESVARENCVLPIAEHGDALKVAISDPDDVETLDKLRFILDRRVEIALAPRDAILEAIDRHYGQLDTESCDSMLQEFTDTSMDFDTAPGASPGDTYAASPSLVEELRQAKAKGTLALAEEADPEGLSTHHAAVRYYNRMIPHRQYDFKVILTAKSLRGFEVGEVTQTESYAFDVDKKEPLEVELVLPGCHVYAVPDTPTYDNRAVVQLEPSGEATVQFTVIPYLKGCFEHCQVVLYQDDRVLRRIPLEVVVRPTTVSYLLGIAGVLIPLFFDQLMAFISQRYLHWFGLDRVSLTFPGWAPFALGGVLLLSAALYFCWRIAPRQRTCAV